MAKIEALVKGSVGFSPDRGDTAVVSNMPFIPVSQGPSVEPGFVLTPDIWKAVRYALVLVLALLMLLFVVRPLVKAVTQAAPETVEQDESNENSVAEANNVLELDTSTSPVNNEVSAGNRVQSVAYATENPRKTAQILRVWLLEDADQQPTLGEMASESKSAEPVQRAGA
jgi:flagellar biosynthesis/type III secretory pathway M-ring protein FliF/YscJ